MLATLVGQVSPTALEQILAMADATDKPESRAWVFAGACPRVRPEQRTARARSALESARLGGDTCRAGVLELVCPHMPPELTPAASDLALLIQDGDQLQRAMAALVPRIPNADLAVLYCFWDRFVPERVTIPRFTLLARLRALLPVLSRLGGANAVIELFSAVRDAGHLWP